MNTSFRISPNFNALGKFNCIQSLKKNVETIFNHSEPLQSLQQQRLPEFSQQILDCRTFSA